MADRYCTRCDGLQRTSPNAVPCTRCNGTGYEPENAPQPPSGASVSERVREVSWPPLARNHTCWVTVNTGDPRGDEHIPLNDGEKATWNRAIEECQRATAYAHGPVGSRGFALAQWLWVHHRGDFPTPEYREIHAALLGVSGEQALTQQRALSSPRQEGEAVYQFRDAYGAWRDTTEGHYKIETALDKRVLYTHPSTAASTQGDDNE